MATEDVSNVALEEVTKAAFNGVLRALEARSLTVERFPGPIIVGIIAWPQMQGQLARELGGQGSTEAAAGQGR